MAEQTTTQVQRLGRLSPEQLAQLAEKVYRLLQDDLRREQARLGQSARRGRPQ